MRISALAILTVLTVLVASPVQAQTYDPRYPVCLQSYNIGGGASECAYYTMAQCNASAQGLGASCVNNPYYSGAQAPGGLPYRR